MMMVCSFFCFVVGGFGGRDIGDLYVEVIYKIEVYNCFIDFVIFVRCSRN